MNLSKYDLLLYTNPFPKAQSQIYLNDQKQFFFSLKLESLKRNNMAQKKKSS